MFTGVITALITPFRDDENRSFDEEAFAALMEEQIAAGIDGVVAVGTTGESPTVTVEENLLVIQKAVEVAKGRTKVIAGTGSNCTREAIEMTLVAEEMGADAALVVTPYYNKPSQKGLILHYQTIAEATPHFPIILYNVPGRTGVKMSAETIIELAKIPNIVGIKNATGDLEDTKALIGNVPADFALLSGDDHLTQPMIAMGGHGVISVASNAKPKEMMQMVHAGLSGKTMEAQNINRELQDFFEACFYESNPMPIKTILAMQGKCQEVFRRPLCSVSEENRERLKKFV